MLSVILLTGIKIKHIISLSGYAVIMKKLKNLHRIHLLKAYRSLKEL